MTNSQDSAPLPVKRRGKGKRRASEEVVDVAAPEPVPEAPPVEVLAEEVPEKHEPHCPSCTCPDAEYQPPPLWPPPARRKGRHPLMEDDAVKIAILSSLEAGNFLEDAAAEAGIHRSTLFRWIQKGEEAEARGELNDYSEFCDAVEMARARGRSRLVTIAANGAADNPELALRMLALMDPRNWGQRVTEAVNEQVEASIEALMQEFAGEAQILKRALRAIAGVGRPGTLGGNGARGGAHPQALPGGGGTGGPGPA